MVSAQGNWVEEGTRYESQRGNRINGQPRFARGAQESAELRSTLGIDHVSLDRGFAGTSSRGRAEQCRRLLPGLVGARPFDGAQPDATPGSAFCRRRIFRGGVVWRLGGAGLSRVG